MGRLKELAVTSCMVLIMVGCGAENAAEDRMIKLPEPETIEFIQYNATKFPAERLETEKLASLVQDLESLHPVANEQFEIDSSFETISLIYDNGKRDVFLFWQENGVWYAQTLDGGIYKNADFLERYYKPQEVETKLIINVPEPSWVQFMKTYGGYDECCDIVMKIVKYLETGYSLEQAADIVETKMMWEEAAYQSAVSQELNPTDEELQAYMLQMVEEIRMLPNYNDIEAICGEMGTNVEEEVYRREQSIRKKRCIEMLYGEVYDAFRCGEDMLDGKVYDNFDSYWNAYINEFISTQQNIDMSAANRLMEKALGYIDINAEYLEELFGIELDE